MEEKKDGNINETPRSKQTGHNAHKSLLRKLVFRSKHRGILFE